MFAPCACAGCLENPNGFFPLRNTDSKWHISWEEMPDEVVGACTHACMHAWLRACGNQLHMNAPEPTQCHPRAGMGICHCARNDDYVTTV